MNVLRVLEALRDGERSGGGRKKLFAEARNPDKWKEIREQPFYRGMLEELRQSGEQYMETPIRSLRFSDYKGFDTTGERKPYEREYLDHRGRLKTFALLSLVDEDPIYLAQLEDTIWAICDEYTWSLPSHMEGESLSIIAKQDVFGRHENANAYMMREQETTVDLFAGETAFALAEICELLEERLAPLVVHRARKLIKDRVLASYGELNRMFWWETTSINWAAVCAGTTGSAALYLIEDADVLAPIVRRVIDTMECFLSGYAEDGACTEGLGYWNYGFGFFVYFAELLRERTNGSIDLLQGEKLKQIALFQQKCYLTGNAIVSYSDASLAANFQPGLTHYLKSRFEEVEAPDFRYRTRIDDDHAHRWAHAVRNFAWSDPRLETSEFKPSTYYLKDARWIISRASDGGNQACFSAKGGHNGEPHNHNDVGSFLFHANGETFLTDPGLGEYTKQYFGPERYDFFVNGSQGHSVPIIDGTHQGAGKSYSDNDTIASSTDEEDTFELDLAGAYAHDGLIRLARKLVFRKQGKLGLALTDAYAFSRKPSEVVERFVTFCRPRIVEPGQVLLQGERGALLIRFDPEQLDCKVESHTFMNHQAKAQDAYSVDLRPRSLKPNMTVTVAFDLV
ncbi:heparinase II/III family protein [Cohnella sp. GCM10027633]|uniref:heparinase II/III domain-containing protein n=1 Tax=unclassified Cohnella TaxID=2636738 RepID=UPI003633BAFE